MKKVLLLTSMLICIFLSSSSLYSQTTGLFTMNYTENGVQHPITFYVPEDYSADKTYPMIFGWHGAQMPGSTMAGWLHSTIAQKEKIILVCVDINKAQTSETLISIVQQSLGYATQTYKVDPGKIVISGYSMGGAYAYMFGLLNGAYFKGIIGTAPAIAVADFSADMWTAVPNIKMATILGTSDEMFGMIDSTMQQIKAKNGQLLYIKKPGVTHGDGDYFNSQDYKDDYKKCWDYIFGITNVEENMVANMNVQLYPNPISTTANISYEIANSSNVSITIQNTLGEVVAKGIEDNYVAAGSYTDMINTSTLVPGMYFCTIKTEYGSETKKFVVVK